MKTRYVNAWTAYLVRGDEPRVQLLWGDACQVLREEENGKWSVVRARGFEGRIETEHLGTESLLELYVIDVGQGDGILMRTPNDRWHLIDAGITAEKQDTRKGAANFLRWKFLKDLRRGRVELENVVVTHADFDHYGGLVNVLGGYVPRAGSRPEQRFEVSVENLFHNGMGRFGSAPALGRTRAGEVPPFPRGDRGVSQDGEFIVELLDGKGDFQSPPRPFEKTFQQFADAAATVPNAVKRLSAADEYLPGYAPSDGAGCTIRVLAPLAEEIGDGVGLRVLGEESITRNGHSVVLRVDHGAARFLLTGDSNTRSQQLLMSYVPEGELACDVAKGCHHGSDDVDLEFVRAMAARATVVSSGDAESYSHPRPRVLGASARYGREAVSAKGQRLPPLLYSTELARSVKLGYASKLEVQLGDDGAPVTLGASSAHFRPEGAGSKEALVPLGETPVALDLVYGLVNVRSDGKHILTATMRESGTQFDYQVFRAGASPQ
jgi:beta-lactamase superfamily II metal-dependent hydrolase